MKNIPLYEVREINSLKDLFESSTRLYSERAAFHVKRAGDENYSPITYKQFKADVEALGTALMSLNLKDKMIAIIGENRYEWVLSFFAAVCGVGIAVPIDRMLPENEILNLLRRSKSSAVIFSDYNKEHVLNAIKHDYKPEYVIGMDYQADEEGVLSFSELLKKGAALLEQGDRSFLDLTIDTEAMNILLFTSATTDQSKAVMLSHRNIAQNLMAMCTMINIVEEDVFLSVLPIHHTYECTCGIICPLYRGASIAFCEGLRHIAKNLKESHATVLLAVPLILEAMYAKIWESAAKNNMDKKLRTGVKLSKLALKVGIDLRKKLFGKVHDAFGGKIRLFISGAAGIDPIISKGFRDLGIFLLQGYGLTECSPIAALNRDVDFKDEAAGLPLPGMEIKIVDANDEGIGEIVVKGPNVMLGYYEDKEATDKVLINGWFYTGDLGKIDRDGFVYITGRKKNVIITKNGKNIYPEEIETLLTRSPYIKECLVSGESDEDGDVVVTAEVVPDYEKIAEEFADAPLNDKGIFDLIQKAVKEVNKELVTYKYVREIKIREEEFEKTTSRKIKRYKA